MARLGCLLRARSSAHANSGRSCGPCRPFLLRIRGSLARPGGRARVRGPAPPYGSMRLAWRRHSWFPGATPVPFEPALQNNARPAAAEIETNPKVDHEFRLHLPIAPQEELVDFRLSTRRNIDAFDFAVVFERW